MCLPHLLLAEEDRDYPQLIRPLLTNLLLQDFQKRYSFLTPEEQDQEGGIFLLWVTPILHITTQKWSQCLLLWIILCIILLHILLT